MSARVLVVDDVPLNVKVLEAKLTSEYFDVITATDGRAAIDLVLSEAPDIVLLDVMMPGMDGIEVCERLKSDPDTAHIPVVMVTALSDISDRVRGLEAGADDFLTKPVEDVVLFARVRSLVRGKMMLDELRLRERTDDALGVIGAADGAEIDSSGGRVLVVADSDHRTQTICRALETEHQVRVESRAEEALRLGSGGEFELAIVSLGSGGYDGLKLCSRFRSTEQTRHLPILILVEEEAVGDLVKGLELGANDNLVHPIDKNELLARTRTQIRHKRYQDRLRQSFRLSVTMAVTDALTGLYNRRYFDGHLKNLLRRSGLSGKPLSLIMLDIDFFKDVNDRYGHLVGDEVLSEFAVRMTHNVRGIDLAARYGGEEFIVALPDTSLATAREVAERLRRAVAGAQFEVSSKTGLLRVTASLGVAMSSGPDDTVTELIRRADESLYGAKQAGRDRVICAAA